MFAIVRTAARISQSSKAHLRGKRGAGGFLQQLLVAALDAAVALVQVHAVAVLVAQHLRRSSPLHTQQRKRPATAPYRS